MDHQNEKCPIQFQASLHRDLEESANLQQAGVAMAHSRSKRHTHGEHQGTSFPNQSYTVVIHNGRMNGSSTLENLM